MFLGTVELGKIPRVIVAIDGVNLKDKLFKARELKADLIEARVDLLETVSKKSVKRFLDTIADFGFFCIATVRPIWEGGKFKKDEEERFAVFHNIISHPAVAAIDIELRAEAILKRTITFAKANGKKVIISYHDFEKTPDEKSIQDIFEKARNLKADIVKCAFKANSYSDVTNVSSLMNKISFPKIFMLMGEKGSISRVDGFIFGSLLTYTFIGKAVAPGQIELEELVKLLAKFYPEYRKSKHLYFKEAL
ncbi:type I 3-dehydroquinate dehydratase [Desulfurobacterium atlanticum]|uniref:3-dehydroquinate dehydratase n=1 Tax=Desulfurobacterium atlanticum TaxID=240169 RepID=A0A238XVL7_9BACT|nr:type I 3-dehydroquinate dehydratase [Desulfurobacterium atlanticum]SNR62039.1 3-dehydroquinate dehydratase [Desulfurobacterium atlanticum]